MKNSGKGTFMMSNLLKAVTTWWYGDPPVGGLFFETVYNEFNVLLYASGLFLDPRPVRWVVTSTIFIFNFTVCAAYVLFLGVTASKQMDDFVTASQTAHFACLDFVTLTIMISLSINRKHMIHILRTISKKYYDYDDDFVIPEMEEEYKSTKKQKIIILTVLPTYLAITALCCMLGRTIDGYFGRASNETQFYHVSVIMKWITGIALLLGSILIAMSILALAVGGGKPSIVALATFLVVAEVLNMAMICGQSEMVLGLGESIHEELYNINWADADVSAKRTIMIMIERSKRPLVLMAGGLQPLNWASFSSIMNTAYSYVNLLMAAEV